MLLSLIYSFCAGDGHLSDVNRLGRDQVAQRITGLKCVPYIRRFGEYLARMSGPTVCGPAGRCAPCLRTPSGTMAAPLPS